MTNSENLARRRELVVRLEEANLKLARVWNQDVRRGKSALPDVHRTYSETAEGALKLLQPGEEGVAWWVQVELYGAFMDASRRLVAGDVPIGEGSALTFVPVRAHLLADWAKGEGPGPRVEGQADDAPEMVDRTRQSYVRPYAEAPEDLIWAPILDWRVKGSANWAG